MASCHSLLPDGAGAASDRLGTGVGPADSEVVGDDLVEQPSEPISRAKHSQATWRVFMRLSTRLPHGDVTHPNAPALQSDPRQRTLIRSRPSSRSPAG